MPGRQYGTWDVGRRSVHTHMCVTMCMHMHMHMCMLHAGVCTEKGLRSVLGERACSLKRSRHVGFPPRLKVLVLHQGHRGIVNRKDRAQIASYMASIIDFFIHLSFKVSVPERLRGLTRNQLGSACAGSSPAGYDRTFSGLITNGTTPTLATGAPSSPRRIARFPPHPP